jgi:cobalt-zinc-cadmium efflux system outer membrane protein
MVWKATLAGALLVLGGCASTSATPGFRDVAKTVEQRTGYRPRWNRDTPADREVGRRIASLLDAPLTVDGAVQVALLNNPSLQDLYEDLSLAQADVVQAGLLSNPVFSADYTAAERDAISPNLILGLTQSFLDLLLIPAKKKVAASQFDGAKFRVGRESGMGDMMEMGRPKNTLPMMSGAGPFGPIAMGGMFTVLKVREGLTSYEDPGWYKQPPGTGARKL